MIFTNGQCWAGSLAMGSTARKCGNGKAMTTIKIVGFSGNVRRPSRTRALVQHIGLAATGRLEASFRSYDLLDAGPGLGAAFTRDDLSPEAASVVKAIEEADALIVGTPVYKGSYTGLFKHLFDFIDPATLADRPVLLTATGGGQKHALVVEHHLRPLFGFFAALTVPIAIYASDGDFVDYQLENSLVSSRCANAAAQLADLLSRRSPGVSQTTMLRELAPSGD
jgi:FMN reductase